MTVLRVGAVTDQIAKESTSQMFSCNCFWENDVKNMQLCNSMAQMSLYTVFGIMDMELCINKHVMTIKEMRVIQLLVCAIIISLWAQNYFQEKVLYRIPPQPIGIL